MIPFFKYQATGNDFVIIDNREGEFRFSIKEIKHICNRRLGIGADGLILIEKHKTADFNLIYYNSDGSQSLCGNGSRAAVRLASELGMIKQKTTFMAYDGLHRARVTSKNITLQMNDVSECREIRNGYFIDTGSPHYIKVVDNLDQVDVEKEGRRIRSLKLFSPGGTNVNFIMRGKKHIEVRTYERGVEGETLSCGTGVTGSALIAAHLWKLPSPIVVKTLGGELQVAFTQNKNGFANIFLTGAADFVFEGEWKN